VQGEHRLGRLTTGQASQLGAPILLVPLGSTEQHGPHLPLDTDTRIAVAWASGIAERLAGAVAAPPLPYGSAGEHQGFAGTLSIGQAGLEVVAVELARSAAATFTALAFVCAHGGNTRPLDAAVTSLRHHGHRVTALYPRWEPDPVRFGPLDAHAGRTETSLMLHLAPDLVRTERATAGTTAPIGELMEDLRRGGLAAVSASGVLGDPDGASAAEGRRLLDNLVERSVAELAIWSADDGDC
jgi:creatinine amidohydrolase